jgi:tRNA 2-thiouridine synthesizing protein A
VTADPRLVDARGLLCPWPALRLARAAREIGSGRIRMVADDPIAPRELERLCAERGWEFAADPSEQNTFDVTIR